MGAIADLTEKGAVYSDGMDSIVIRRCGACLIGGCTLDMTGFPDDTVRAGHFVIHETITDTYKPLGVKDGAYVAIPEGHTYEGVVLASQSAKQPFVSVMYEGEVNDLASPYPVTDTIKEALKTTLPGLYFKHD